MYAETNTLITALDFITAHLEATGIQLEVRTPDRGRTFLVVDPREETSQELDGSPSDITPNTAERQG